MRRPDSARKRTPDHPDIAPRLDRPSGSLHSHAVWEFVEADASVAVDQQLADVELREVVWSDADLAGRQFTGLRCRDVRFSRCDLAGAILESADLMRVEFIECRMVGLVLSGARLQDVRIRESRADLMNLRMVDASYLLIEGTSLREADLYRARLGPAGLLDCDLTAANFGDCTLSEVDLHRSKLDDLRGADALRGATISPEQMITLAPALLRALDIAVTDSPRITG